jgi:hypothetical protein
VIPISGGNTDRQIMVMKDFGVTAICCTPSYFLHLIDRAAELGVDMRDLPLRVGVFGAEPWTESMRKHIESQRHQGLRHLRPVRDHRPGRGHRVPCQDGLHIFEDHFYPEIIDPETGEVLPDGEEGELVLTTLSKQAMPMIRYRTRDITRSCHRALRVRAHLRRMRRIGRRSDDMLIIRGVNVFPSQIEAALLEVEGTLPHYQIILTREQGLDQMEVQVEVTPQMFSDKIGALDNCCTKAWRTRSSTLGHPRGRSRWSSRLYHPAQRRQGQTRHRQADIMKIQQLSLFLENKPGHIRALPPAGAGRHRHSRLYAGRHAAIRHSAHDRLRLGEGRKLLEAAATWSTSPRWWPSRCPTVPAAWPGAGSARRERHQHRVHVRLSLWARARRC